MTLITAKWTLAEYHRLAETGILDDRRVELLWEDIVERAAEAAPHAYSSSEAGEYLNWIIERSRQSPAKSSSHVTQ